MTPEQTDDPAALVTPDRIDAVLFDLDGVLTDTASVHSAAWKQMFDEYLQERADRTDERFAKFTDDDYLAHVDGKARLDGVRDFLASRDIVLPEGNADCPPTEESVNGLGQRKNELVRAVYRTEGVRVFDTSVDWVRKLLADGIKTAVVSSSRDCALVLEVAGITELFEIRVDGEVREELGLPGKPAPDTYLEAARELGVEPSRSVVVEDAISGVQAGRAGDFGLVLGVGRRDNRDQLLDAGADIVVDDLGEMLRGSE